MTETETSGLSYKRMAELVHDAYPRWRITAPGRDLVWTATCTLSPQEKEAGLASKVEGADHHELMGALAEQAAIRWRHPLLR